MTAYKPSVWVRTAKFGTKSFELEYLITSLDKEGNDIIHAKGKSTQVMFDTKSRQTMVIPEWLKEELTAYEKVI